MVQLTSANEEAAVVLQAEKSSESLASFAKKKAAELDGGRFVNEQPGSIHGLNCLHQIFDFSRPHPRRPQPGRAIRRSRG